MAYGKALKSLDDAPLAALTIFGGSGRDNCPTSVSSWKVPVLGNSQLMLQDSRDLQVNCGSLWTEWSSTCDENRCGDDIRTRTRFDRFGKAIRDQQNCGRPCDSCAGQNENSLCEVFERSGYCIRPEMNSFMKENCSTNCCVFTGDLTF